MVTDLPKYMTDVLKFNIRSTGLLSAMPYVAMWIASFLFGLICDFCIKRKYHSIMTARKLYTTIGKKFTVHYIYYLLSCVLLNFSVYCLIVFLWKRIVRAQFHDLKKKLSCVRLDLLLFIIYLYILFYHLGQVGII